MSDLAEGLCKGVVFGAIVASVSCLRGFQTGVGPQGRRRLHHAVGGQQHSVNYSCRRGHCVGDLYVDENDGIRRQLDCGAKPDDWVRGQRGFGADQF